MGGGRRRGRREGAVGHSTITPEVELDGECDEETDAEAATKASFDNVFTRRVLRLGQSGARSLEEEDQQRAWIHIAVLDLVTVGCRRACSCP